MVQNILISFALTTFGPKKIVLCEQSPNFCFIMFYVLYIFVSLAFWFSLNNSYSNER